MEQGLVSIIVPVYNREGLIKDTLNSLIRQTYHHWECIIVDDGSTDNTIKTVIYYCKKDNRFKLKIRNKKPKGAPSCRNLGLKEALGEFLIFLDSDDILLPNAIESRVNYLQANRQIDFCVSNGIKGVYPIDKKKEYFLISNFYSSDVLGQFFNLSPPWVSLNPTYRVCKLVNKNIFWDEMLLGYQDIDFHISVILKKLKFGYLNGKPDCLWRKHKQGNVAHVLNKGDNQFNQLLYIFNKYRKIEEVDKQQIAPLVARLFNQFIYAKISLRKVFISIRIFASENEKYYLLKFLIYFVLRISIRYKIPLVPKYCRKVLYKLGDGYIFNVLPKTHYLINKVNFNKIIIEPSI